MLDERVSAGSRLLPNEEREASDDQLNLVSFCSLKGLCVDIQTQNCIINNINEAVIQTQMYLFLL